MNAIWIRFLKLNTIFVHDFGINILNIYFILIEHKQI